MIVQYSDIAYRNFLEQYPDQCKIDTLTGNGSFEIRRGNDELFGNFAISYSKKPKRWGMTLYGLFGMVLSQIELKDDSFNIFTPFLDKPLKGSIKNFKIEDYTGIPIDPLFVPLLLIGRIPIENLHPPSYFLEKKNLIEFSSEDGKNISRFGWSSSKNRVEYYWSGKKDEKDFLDIRFKDFGEIGSLSFPYTLLFTYKGKDEAYLQLKYKYLNVNPKPDKKPKTSD